VPNIGCGPLAVFKTFESAKKFLRLFNFRSIEIWKCKYSPSEETYLRDPLGETSIKRCPEGTVLADSIRLIERVMRCGHM
jgi:hypothetical protein